MEFREELWATGDGFQKERERERGDLLLISDDNQRKLMYAVR